MRTHTVDQVTGIPLRILVVDDNHDGAQSLALLLSMRGHEVRACFSGEQALATAAAFKPQLAIVDLLMPVMGGLEVCQALRKADAKVMLVALTAYQMPAARPAAVQPAFDDRLLKPTKPEELTRILESAQWRVSLDERAARKDAIPTAVVARASEAAAQGPDT